MIELIAILLVIGVIAGLLCASVLLASSLFTLPWTIVLGVVIVVVLPPIIIFRLLIKMLEITQNK